ncbi:MAG: IF-2-associated domain-containing protein, partial [Alphaproteobacteria bacterium]|nr:IF-2-associated domain-containing protein [Alphaproteobacteria bacterium]
MTDKKEETESKLTLRKPGRLELKKTVDAGQVSQSFSHGRTKKVAVEVKRKRTFERGAGGKMTAVSRQAAAAEPEKPEAAPALRNLTDREREARVRALKGAAVEDEKQRLVDLQAKHEAEDAARRAAQEESQRRLQEEEEARRSAAEGEASRKAEEEAARRKAAEARVQPAQPEPVL